MNKALLTLGEAADALSLGKTTLRGLIDRGEIRVIRVGALVRVPAREIAAWIEAQLEGDGAHHPPAARP